jgi:hypothetical protein
MKGKFKLLLVTVFVACGVLSAQTQLSDEEYSYVTMDLQGVLDLTMTSRPQVDFTFSSIKDYQNGIIKFNAVQLEVDATVAWDLYVYAADVLWDQVESFSTNGAGDLPPEILMISSSVDNSAIDGAIGVGKTLQSLRGSANAGIVDGAPSATTQFLAGDFGTVLAGGVTDAAAPGTAAGTPDTHKFRINYALYPGVPATFNGHGETYNLAGLDLAALPGNTSDYAQAGYYYLEVVYSLVEDL